VKRHDEAIEHLQSVRRDGTLVFVAHPHTFKKAPLSRRATRLARLGHRCLRRN
jgi:hypothetical protein